MSDLPLVSICIPVYNGANYLDEALRSAFAQAYKNIEIVIVDDGSIDGGQTWEIIKSYGERVRAFQQPNAGVSAALNTCIKNMRGEYFSWLSHDDLYAPVKISTQMEYILGKTSFKGILFSNYSCIDKNGSLVADPNPDMRYFDTIYHVILATYIHGCSLLIPKTAFEIAGCFDESLKTVCDNDLWLRMALAGIPFDYQPFRLVYSRDHGERASYGLRNIHADETALFYITAVKKLIPHLASLNVPLLKEILSQKPAAAQALKLLCAATSSH